MSRETKETIKEAYELINNGRCCDDLLDRLTLLLSKPFKPTKLTMKKIEALQVELNKLELTLI